MSTVIPLWIGILGLVLIGVGVLAASLVVFLVVRNRKH